MLDGWDKQGPHGRSRPQPPWGGAWSRSPGLARSLVALDRGDFQLDQKLAATPGKARIRCPVCTWQPQRSSRWYCLPMGAPEFFSGGCGQCWNTFDTRGRCPGCSHQWRYTSCLRCGATSLHDDWYEKGPDIAGPQP